jgi:hypothetical protein
MNIRKKKKNKGVELSRKEESNKKHRNDHADKDR